MRVKTDEKRQEIMDAASAVFGEMGYEKAGMAAIARRAGASKQTLYSYFESKEDLFSAVMIEAMESQADALFGLLDGKAEDLEATLEAFGRAYIDFVTSPEVLNLTRVAVTEGAQGVLGPRLYSRGPMRGWAAIAANLERWGREGRLVVDDPEVAALHLKGLLEAGLVEPRLYGAAAAVSRDQAARQGVRVFLAGYRPPIG
ncbi:TetR/AcrR family transcriptional regulator [Brevundimonas sp. NPDC090276]|uniref:TetR/AcrR family transcriptional regulator n=1 Tax=Brevundimonas sp. NPDC090276 TaxID=3363956 RepID=UPI00383B7461